MGFISVIPITPNPNWLPCGYSLTSFELGANRFKAGQFAFVCPDGDQVAVYHPANKVNCSRCGGLDLLPGFDMEVDAPMASAVFANWGEVILFKVFIEVGDGFGPDFSNWDGGRNGLHKQGENQN
jgi:hypothetical protein